MGTFHIECDEGWGPSAFRDPGSFTRIGSERRFGVELEYFTVEDWESLEGETVFGAKYDGSVDGEFYSPIMQGDNGLAECEKFCDLASRLDFTVDPLESGLHIHLDMSSEKLKGLKSIALGYHLTRKYWQSAVHPHRNTTEWCRKHAWTGDDLKPIRSLEAFHDFAWRTRRHSWINLAAYQKHHTFEVRNHESTLNGADVVAWVTAHARFTDAMARMGDGTIEQIFHRKQLPGLVREMTRIIDNPIVSAKLNEKILANSAELA